MGQMKLFCQGPLDLTNNNLYGTSESGSGTILYSLLTNDHGTKVRTPFGTKIKKKAGCNPFSYTRLLFSYYVVSDLLMRVFLMTFTTFYYKLILTIFEYQKGFLEKAGVNK